MLRHLSTTASSAVLWGFNIVALEILILYIAVNIKFRNYNKSSSVPELPSARPAISA